ncbi:MAG TPA: hypothetical protein VFX59_22220 [Polyangiales bacterium]|nr:hypothetical protein [Polyangiales bacterium]
MNVFRTASLLAVFTTAACGVEPEDPDASEDELSETETPDVLQAAVKCDPKRPLSCNPQRVTPEQDRIWNKIASLPADVQSAYYATPLTSYYLTPDGNAIYQWYEGSRGRGTIYEVNDTSPFTAACPASSGIYAIYGAILDEWERGGYERGLGYPRSERFSVTGGRQSFRCTSSGGPSVANQGLVKEVVVIQDDRANGQGSVQRDRYYMVGRDPGSTSSGPQQCRYVDSYTCPTYNPSPTWIEPVYDTATPIRQFLWCGSGDPYAGACPEGLKP